MKEKIEDVEKSMLEKLIKTITIPDNADVLYSLHSASKHTRENVTPERLVELTGLYIPLYSTDSSIKRVRDALKQLQGMAYVHGKQIDQNKVAYELTGAGLITIQFLDIFLKMTVEYENELKNTISSDASTRYKELYRTFRRVDERFKEGI